MYLVEISRLAIRELRYAYASSMEELEEIMTTCNYLHLPVRAIYKKNAKGHYIRKSFDYDPIEGKLTLYK